MAEGGEGSLSARKFVGYYFAATRIVTKGADRHK